MHLKEIVSAVHKQTGLSEQDAEKAVNTVMSTLRQSTEATMIFRKVEGKSQSPEDRRTVHLCG